MTCDSGFRIPGFRVAHFGIHHKTMGLYLRWPTTVAAISNSARQNQNAHGETKMLTAKQKTHGETKNSRQKQKPHGKTKSSRQNQKLTAKPKAHGKTKKLTAKPKSSRQNKRLTAKTKNSRQNQELTAKPKSSRQNQKPGKGVVSVEGKAKTGLHGLPMWFFVVASHYQEPSNYSFALTSMSFRDLPLL